MMDLSLGMQLPGQDIFRPDYKLSVPLQAWYYGSKGASTAVDGDPVETWADQSGNGHDLTQSTVAKRPTFETNEINGKPVLRFDGTDDIMKTADFGGDISQPNTLFLVLKPISVVLNNKFFEGISGTKRHSVGTATDDKFSVYAGAAGTGSTIITAGTTYIMTILWDTTTSHARINGAVELAAPDNFGSHVLSGITIGAYLTETQWANFDMAEIVLYNGELMSDEINLVEGYLNSEYNVY